MNGAEQGPGQSKLSGRGLPIDLVIFGIWMIAFGAAAMLEYAPNASLWFPPAAVTFAAVMAIGLRALPAIWLACLLVTLLGEQIFQRGLGWFELLAAGLGFGLTHTLAYAALALLLRTGANPLSALTTFSRLSLFVIGGAIAAGLSSLMGGLSLAATGAVDISLVPGLIIPWWIGDYTGLLSAGLLLTIVLAQTANMLDRPAPGGLSQLPGSRSWLSLWPVEIGKLVVLGWLTLAALLAGALV